MQKILMVDCDGVLNTFRDIGRYGNDALNGRCLEELRRIVVVTDCKIVISSSWRLWEDSMKVIRYWFGVYGFEGAILGVTPCLDGPRCEEIQSWLTCHDKEVRVAVLDDEPDAQLESRPGSFFKTDPTVGLTKEVADAVISYLNKT